MANPRQVRKPTQLARLWVHECSRVFADRLVSSDDRQWFTESMRPPSLRSHPKLRDGRPGRSAVAYTNFMQTAKDLRKYEEVSDDSVLRTTAEQYLSSHDEMVTANSAAGTRAAMAAGAKAAKKEAVAKMMGGSSDRTALAGGNSVPPLKLVMFTSAVTHLVRISRVISQPAGSALLIGVGGSGRRSLTRLAAYIQSLELHTMTLSKEYRSQEWREDLRRVVTRAGRDGVPLVFVVTDTVLRDQDWLLEDAQRLLDFAEVPGLLAADEMEGILAKLRALAPDAGRDPDSSMRIWFLERCVLNLRFAFIVSPLGNALRGKLRACPALAQCTTIDWFDEWPVEALQAVARSELSRSRCRQRQS